MKVCFIKTKGSYLPEIYAYSKFLTKKGVSNIVVASDCEARSVSANLYYRFGGLLNKSIKNEIPEIHEYHTISIGRFSLIKNILKSISPVKPVYLSFLNKFVESKYFFSKEIPCFYRDMGASEELLFLRNCGQSKQFDICYFGSISDRLGLVDTVISLAEQGYSLVLGGRASTEDLELFKRYKKITFLGVCSREAVYSYMGQSRLGLNYMPNKYPLNQQTSTKVIEYLVAGLPIISNSYQWINKHSKKLGYEYITMDENNNVILLNDEKDKYILPVSQAELLTWDSILERCEFEKIIRHCMVK